MVHILSLLEFPLYNINHFPLTNKFYLGTYSVQ